MIIISIVVFSAHPDDELLITAGIIRKAIESGIPVQVVVVTNGDIHGKLYGQTRIVESATALSLVGLPVQNHIFLGYGDQTLKPLYEASSDTEIIESFVGTETYGVPNFVPDFHSYWYGTPGSYDRKTLSADMQTILRIYKPDYIYTTSMYDTHPDHSALYFFTVDTIIKMKKIYPTYSPKLLESIVHPLDDSIWPTRETDPSPLVKFSEVPNLSSYTILKWDQIEDIPVPPLMQIVPRTENLKYQSIQKYVSQKSSFLDAFVKSNEFFWERDFSNIAYLAEVTVSSENTDTGQLGIKAIDGIREGYPRFPSNEWVTDGELDGAWIQLDWPRTYLINRIVLYDRPNDTDHIEQATLNFSDGSSLPVGELPDNGEGFTVTFPPKLVSWVRLTLNQVSGFNAGLAEFEVYDSNIAPKANVTVSSENIAAGQSGIAAIDGVVSGYPEDFTKEWVTNGELAGAWIQLDWPENYTIDHIVLYDRVNGFDRIEGGILEFSDGSSLSVGALQPGGIGTVIEFPPKTVNSVKFTVTQASGQNVGLAEFEVHQALLP